jgi:charged multivesicular body protein 3
MQYYVKWTKISYFQAVNKLHATCAQINSIHMSMQHQLATMRMAGTLKQSADVMRAMQQLIKVLTLFTSIVEISKKQMNVIQVPEVMQVMREMAKEMMKMGLIEEIVEETMESFEPEDMEALAQVTPLNFQ